MLYERYDTQPTYDWSGSGYLDITKYGFTINMEIMDPDLPIGKIITANYNFKHLPSFLLYKKQTGKQSVSNYSSI